MRARRRRLFSGRLALLQAFLGIFLLGLNLHYAQIVPGMIGYVIVSVALNLLGTLVVDGNAKP